MKRVILTVVVLLFGARAGAHHSFAVFFDTQDKLVSVTGIVRDFQFRNPHGVITLDVPTGQRHDHVARRDQLAVHSAAPGLDRRTACTRATR